MQETWVRSLGWEDPLEESMATHSSILAWRIPMDRGAWWATVYGVAESDTTEQLSHTHTHTHTHTIVNRSKVFLTDFFPFFLLPRSLVNCPLICPQTTALVCQDQQCLYYRLETWICYCTSCSLLSANSRVLTVIEGLLRPFPSYQTYVPLWFFFFFKEYYFKKSSILCSLICRILNLII